MDVVEEGTPMHDAQNRLFKLRLTRASPAWSCLPVFITWRLHPEQLAHEYLDNGRQFGKAEMLLAGKQLGLKAKFVRSKVERLEHTPLPAIAASQDGRFFIIARLDDGKALIHDPLVQRPEVFSLDELQARWTGELMLITSQD